MSQAVDENVAEIGIQIKQKRQNIERAKLKLLTLKTQVSRVENYINTNYDNIKELHELIAMMREEEGKRNEK